MKSKLWRDAEVLEHAAAILSDDRIVGGAYLGAAEDCRQLARIKRDEVRRRNRVHAAERVAAKRAEEERIAEINERAREIVLKPHRKMPSGVDQHGGRS